MIKMYCVFALESVKKMNGIRGKLASMAGHAYLHAYWDSESRFPGQHGYSEDEFSDAEKYRNSGVAYKITLMVDTVAELEKLRDEYAGICGVSLVKDAGLTVFDGPTVVCLGIGPIHVDNLSDNLKSLKTFT